MEITARLNSLRISPRKVRLLARLLKGRDALAAKHQLHYLAKRSTLPLEKLLNSALSNAENNFNLVSSNLRIKEVMVNGGQVLKRFEPKGFGSVSPIAKRTSHIIMVLEEKVPGMKGDAKVKTEKTAKHDHEHKDEAKPEVKKELGKKEGAVKKFSKRMFQRKSI